ncbi:hypothetical protein [Cyanobium sp. ATX-6F1]|uniref:hypothetical protein n=1 Tax=Cyanobium sp. ATX-6F1 TaxID=3137388 RepID=UPI0039BDD298
MTSTPFVAGPTADESQVDATNVGLEATDDELRKNTQQAGAGAPFSPGGTPPTLRGPAVSPTPASAPTRISSISGRSVKPLPHPAPPCLNQGPRRA